MRFEVTVLGSNAAIPTAERFTSAQILNVQEQLFLIDCGEGTQLRMGEYQVRRNKIQQIFISHLHGDHIFGLMGLLTSYSLNGRKKGLHIYAPEGLSEMIEIQLKHTQSYLSYSLHFHTVNPTKSEIIFENSILTVQSIPLRHRIPAAGFLFREKPFKRKIIAAKIEAYQIPYSEINGIKAGADFVTSTGTVIPNAELTTPPPKSRSFAYCSDTMYHEAIIPLIEGIDCLYHETTFMHDELPRAIKTMHTTAHQAAQLAAKAKVGRLIMGHYSSRYTDLTELLAEARAVFPESYLGLDGKQFEVALK
ncbi:MAG: ribonuclease Z [Saprospiraceae bacterium]